MKQIKNVLAWSLLQDELLYTDNVNNLFISDALNDDAPEKYSLNYSPTFFYRISDNGFVIVDELNHPASIYAGKKLLPVDWADAGDIFINKQDPRYLVLYKGEMEDQVFRIFDWVEKKVMMEAEKPPTIVKGKAFLIGNGVLRCFTLDGSLNWQYKPGAADPQFVHTAPAKIIGIYNNELWVKVNDNSFIVLDADTGKAILPNFNVTEKLGGGFSMGEVHLDEQGNKLRILAYLYYIEIDLVTHTAAIKKKYDDNWSIGAGRFYEGDVSVYFVGNNSSSGKGIGKKVAGIFNTQTLEVEWYYALPGEDRFHFFVDQPQANKKYVAVKDSNETLYMFEREMQ